MSINKLNYNGTEYDIQWDADGKWIVNNFSNMATVPIEHQGRQYKSVEHAYQAAKFTDPAKKAEVQRAYSAKSAKFLGKKWPVETPDWRNVSVQIMWDLCAQKWTKEPFRAQMLAQEKPYIEWNNWNDRIWGVATNPEGKIFGGQNLLGRILTDIRRQIIAAPDKLPAKPEELKYSDPAKATGIARPQQSAPATQAVATQPGAAGYIRLTNKRKNMGPKPAPGETLVAFDRENPILGNRHILHDHTNEDERTQVIAAYKADLDADWAKKGPMYDAVVKLAQRVIKGEAMAGQCWCAGPYRCHGENIIERVKEVVKTLDPKHPFGQQDFKIPGKQTAQSQAQRPVPQQGTLALGGRNEQSLIRGMSLNLKPVKPPTAIDLILKKTADGKTELDTWLAAHTKEEVKALLARTETTDLQTIKDIASKIGQADPSLAASWMESHIDAKLKQQTTIK